MPRSIFLGRPYPQPGDPLFLADDIEAVLEMQREEDLMCPGCGLPRDETMSKEAQDAYKARILRCHACAARERAASRFVEEKGSLGGALFAIEHIDH